MNNSMLTLQETIYGVWNAVVLNMIDFVPRLLFALLLLFLGLLLAGWAKTLVKGLVRAFDLGKLTKNTALDAFLTKAEIKLKVEDVLGEIAKLIVIYLFLIMAVNIIGLTALGDFLGSLLGYVPRLISATVILAIGVLLAGFVESFVKGIVGNVDVATGRLMGKAASYMVVIFAALVAIAELGIAERFINTIFIGVVASLALGIGIALGFGSKEVVGTIITQWYKRLTQENVTHKKDV